MRKKLLLILLMLAVVCTCSLTACSKPAQLVMGEVSYDAATKTISWNKVSNAKGYSLRVDNKQAVTEFTISENKVQYVLEEDATGTYTIYVKAIGDNKKHVNSAEKWIKVNYLKPLVLGEISYNPQTKIISWDEIDNAVGYYLRIGSGEPVSIPAQNKGKIEYPFNQDLPGTYTIYVKAVAFIGEHSDSAERSVKATQTVELVLGDMSYEPTTKVVSWNNILGASGYSLKVGASGTPVTQFTQNGNRIEYVLNQAAPGAYQIYLKAIGGDGWLDSAEKTLEVDYKLLITMGELTYNEDERVISWDSVANATGYSLRIGDEEPITSGFIEDDVNNKIKFMLPANMAPGSKSIYVSAIGNETYGDSAAKLISIDLVAKLGTPKVQTFLSKISWNSVEFAEEYVVQIDDREPIVLDSDVLSYLLLSLTEIKTYSIRIKATGGEHCIDSGWATVTYKPSSATVAGGANFSVAIDENGNLYTWGSNSSGQLGNGSTGSNVTTPTSIMAVNTGGDGALTASTKFNMVSAGTGLPFALAIDTEGNLYAWGDNSKGQLGIGNTTNQSKLVQVKPGTKFITASAGSSRCLAIDANGDMWAWGSTNDGLAGLGDGSTDDSLIPIKISASGKKFAVVNASYDSCAAITVTGELYTWGYNNVGQLGSGNTYTYNRPTLIKTSKRMVAVSGSYYSYIAIDEDGGIWVSGGNNKGELGDNTTNTSTTFKKVTFSAKPNARFISVGGYEHHVAVDEDGEIWTWGNNSNAQLGNGNTIQQTRPVRLTVAGRAFAKVARPGQTHSLAVATNGTLYTWGNNANGRTGLGTTSSNTTAPTVIASFKVKM